MRRGRDPEVHNVDGKLYGFNLGADYVSEHEWGIKKIEEKFGVGIKQSERKSFFTTKENQKELIGVDKNTVTIFPEENIVFGSIEIKEKTYWALMCLGSYYGKMELNIDTIKSNHLIPYENASIVTAWDERTFGILVDENYKGDIIQLYEAFKRKDVVMGIGGSHAFKNGGLIFIVRSAMTEEEVNRMYENDLNSIRLQEAVDATNIENILKDAGKRYFALSPKWKNEKKNEVTFWLNPMEQHIHNSGWYNVEELKQWVMDEGPIMKK